MINPKALEGLLHNVCLTEPVSIQPVICKWTIKKKLQSYNLCMRIMGSTAEVDITLEDAVLIKEAVGGLTPGCFSQIIKLIEG